MRRKKNSEKPCGCGCNSSGKKLVLQIEGMHCSKCQNGVSEALKSLDGVSAIVDLEKKCAFVELSKDVPQETLTQAVTDRGFDVIAIKTE